MNRQYLVGNVPQTEIESGMIKETAQTNLNVGSKLQAYTRHSLFFLLVLFGTAMGLAATTTTSFAADSEAFTEYQGRQVLEVSVHRNGSVFTGGSEHTIGEIDDLFKSLKSVGGTVWYYREGPETSASAKSADAIIELIIKHRLPICLSETPDFSACKK